MTKATQLEIKIEELNEIEKMMEELKAEADAIKDELKSEMSIRGLDQMEVGQYIVRWTSVISSRFDTKRFKEEYGENIYKQYTKEVSSMRFSIAH